METDVIFKNTVFNCMHSRGLYMEFPLYTYTSSCEPPCPRQTDEQRESLSGLREKSPRQQENAVTKRFSFFLFFFFFFFGLFRATPAAHGGSQARGLIRAVAAGLLHSNTGSLTH